MPSHSISRLTVSDKFVCPVCCIFSLFPPCFSGVRVVAGAVGNLPSVLDSDELGLALGGLEGVECWESEEDNSGSLVGASTLLGHRKHPVAVDRNRDSEIVASPGRVLLDRRTRVVLSENGCQPDLVLA